MLRLPRGHLFIYSYCYEREGQPVLPRTEAAGRKRNQDARQKQGENNVRIKFLAGHLFLFLYLLLSLFPTTFSSFLLSFSHFLGCLTRVAARRDRKLGVERKKPRIIKDDMKYRISKRSYVKKSRVVRMLRDEGDARLTEKYERVKKGDRETQRGESVSKGCKERARPRNKVVSREGKRLRKVSRILK